MKKIISSLRYLKFIDFINVFFLLISLIPALIFKIYNKFRNKELWLICEDKNEARDNGYVFFKYVCNKKDKNIMPVYAINKRSVDYEKVKKIGKVISYETVVHWIYYLAADKNISSQKGGKPNAPICYFLEVYGILKNKRVFLQHGITLSNAEWLYYSNTKMKLFVCGAEGEYEFVKKKFGYHESNVKYLGFARFDDLHDFRVKSNQILIMPTWREWLTRKTDAYYKFGYDGVFEHSDYYKYWNDLVNNKEFIEFVEKNDLKVIFYPHRNMQPYINSFKTKSDNIVIASWKDYDIQNLLKESAIMITDYSSVCMDFSYMRKPVIYYQFDQKEFREGQYKEGYFDYNDGFGDMTNTVEQLIDSLKNSYNSKFVLEEKYKEKIDNFFVLNDNKNCERIYKEIIKV